MAAGLRLSGIYDKNKKGQSTEGMPYEKVKGLLKRTKATGTLKLRFRMPARDEPLSPLGVSLARMGPVSDEA